MWCNHSVIMYKKMFTHVHAHKKYCPLSTCSSLYYSLYFCATGLVKSLVLSRFTRVPVQTELCCAIVGEQYGTGTEVVWEWGCVSLCYAISPSSEHTVELLASRTVHCCTIKIILSQRVPLGWGLPPAAGGTLGHQHCQGNAQSCTRTTTDMGMRLQ